MEAQSTQQLFNEVLTQNLLNSMKYDNLGDMEKLRSTDQLIDLYSQLLHLELDVKKEIIVHQDLGGLFFGKGILIGDNAKIASATSSNDYPLFYTALTEFEKALSLDAKYGANHFKDRLYQSIVLPDLDFLWMLHSLTIRRQQDYDAAIAYLYQKVKMLEYLGNIPLPSIYSQIGIYCNETRRAELAIEWLKRAIMAEDFGDILGGDNPKYIRAQKAKNHSRRILQRIAF